MMDVKEAIEILKDDNRDICYGTTLTNEAINMAIEALSALRTEKTNTQPRTIIDRSNEIEFSDDLSE